MGERKFKVGDEVLVKGTVIEVTPDKEYLIDSSLGRLYALGDDLLGYVNTDKTYEQGLEEGWELAKKVIDMSYDDRDKILGTNLDNHSIDCIIESFTAAQVKEKIEEYERLNIFNVGDVVNVNGYLKGIITYVYSDKNFDILLDNGITRTHEQASNCEKINKHIDICETLNKF